MPTENISTTIARNEQEIQQALQIRRSVFIEGQQVPEDLEQDGRDNECTHFLLWKGNELIGAGRMRRLDGNTVKFERMAVLDKYRNQGYGTKMLEYMLKHARLGGFTKVTLHAQIDAVTYYERAGFEKGGEEFTEAGIVHVAMNKDLS
ncbi:MAG: Acetyltransferase [Candidatus Marinimicrobia bacterium]|nr:Acetyltransferase [Candidatus Neomarinimicrobiota bacterium]